MYNLLLQPFFLTVYLRMELALGSCQSESHCCVSITISCVALRIDEIGDLVLGKAGAKADDPTQPWPALLTQIEANLEVVARLVEAGWHLRADLPKLVAA